MKTSMTVCAFLLLLLTAFHPLPAQGSDAAYYRFTRDDMRLCPSPVCGGIFVKAVNRFLTRCPDGTLQFECYVAAVDFSALHLSDAEMITFLPLFRRGLGIIKGTFRLHSLEGVRSVADLVAEEAWQAQGENRRIGISYLFRDNGTRCITFPCPSVDEMKLNSSRIRSIAGLDLSQNGATEQEIAAGLDSLFTTGLIALGTHRIVQGPGGRGIEFIASQFYLRVKPSEKSCGGVQGAPCPGDSFCDVTAPGACADSSLAGLCKPVPDVCTLEYNPVCGCDGKTYGNDCERLAAMVKLDHAGQCSAPGP